MALGDRSKSLITISKAKGWDPNVIEGTGENIGNFNKAPDPWKLGNQSVGKLPEGTPNNFSQDHAPDLTERVTFQTPDVRRESNHTTNADPNEGRPGGH